MEIHNFNRGWTWGYDAIGQVTAAVNATDTGLNRSYAYDAIGNRTSATDGTGGGAVTTGYSPNILNQFETINPGDPVSPVHDLDGNLTEDAAVNQDSEDRQYVWDAENRLVAVNKVDSRDENDEITGTTLLASYEYDPLGRRIRTITTAAANQDVTDIGNLYDGWNVAIEYVIGMIEDPQDPEEEIPGPVVHTFNVWGLDLSGSLQGAGGVGGLLATGIFHGTNQGFYFPTYDGNGNISEYLQYIADDPETLEENEENILLAVHFEYDPFGRLAVDPEEQIVGISEVLTYRFSTKPIGFESGLYYYTYRYYDPVTGRWPSRDPIEEEGGVNLYGFVRNNGVNQWDFLGTEPSPSSPPLVEGPCCCKIDGILTKDKPTAEQVKNCITARAKVIKRYAYFSWNPLHGFGIYIDRVASVDAGGQLPSNSGVTVRIDYELSQDGDCACISELISKNCHEATITALHTYTRSDGSQYYGTYSTGVAGGEFLVLTRSNGMRFGAGGTWGLDFTNEPIQHLAINNSQKSLNVTIKYESEEVFQGSWEMAEGVNIPPR